MPVLERITIRDFRNIELQEIPFSPNINCIGGGNGEGKTNLLDAIWYLSMTKSALGSGDSFNFRHGCDSFEIMGEYAMESGMKSRFSVSVKSGGEKTVKRDGKSYGRMSAHIGQLPVVMVSPADIAMISESGEERRKFVNAVLSQMDSEYLSLLQQYNRLLMQRNRLLKSGMTDESLLESFDAKMSTLATPIYEKRRAFCTSLLPLASDYYARISGGQESVGIEYRSDLMRGDLETQFRERRAKDAILKYTTAGIQRDDFIFTMDGFPIRRCGSQGQQKSFLVALKFAQYELMKERYGFPPIMLLDDLFDKLDPRRVSNLLSLVADRSFGQIFLSDADKARTRTIVDALTDDRIYIRTKGGVYTIGDE